MVLGITNKLYPFEAVNIWNENMGEIAIYNNSKKMEKRANKVQSNITVFSFFFFLDYKADIYLSYICKKSYSDKQT